MSETHNLYAAARFEPVGAVAGTPADEIAPRTEDGWNEKMLWICQLRWKNFLSSWQKVASASVEHASADIELPRMDWNALFNLRMFVSSPPAHPFFVMILALAA